MNLQKYLNYKQTSSLFTKQGDTSEKNTHEITALAKLFDPCGSTTIYLYEKEDEDTYMAFTCLNGDAQNAELGRVSIAEIQAIKRPMGLTFEFDTSFKPMNLKELIDKVKLGKHV